MAHPYGLLQYHYDVLSPLYIGPMRGDRGSWPQYHSLRVMANPAKSLTLATRVHVKLNQIGSIVILLAIIMIREADARISHSGWPSAGHSYCLPSDITCFVWQQERHSRRYFFWLAHPAKIHHCFWVFEINRGRFGAAVAGVFQAWQGRKWKVVYRNWM